MAEGTRHSDACPRCGHSVVPDHRFCAECGCDLSQKTCPACDATNDLDANFCTACGAALTVAAPSAPAPVPTPPEPAVPEIEDPAEFEPIAGPPDDWDPQAVDDDRFPDVRTDLPENVAGNPMPFEPRRVPAEGMAAWTRADAANHPDDRLSGNTDLIVMERNGPWAHVLGENGWKGWVDDRLLIDPDLAAAPPAPPASPPPPPASPPGPVGRPEAGPTSTVTMPTSDPVPARKWMGFTKRPVTIAGAITAVIAIFLPWFPFDSGLNGFDVPVTLLFGGTDPGSVFSVGAVLLGLGGFAAAIVMIPGLAKRGNLLIPLGIGILAVAGFFLYHLTRSPYFDLFEILAAGPIVTIAAGALVLTRR